MNVGKHCRENSGMAANIIIRISWRFLLQLPSPQHPCRQGSQGLICIWAKCCFFTPTFSCCGLSQWARKSPPAAAQPAEPGATRLGGLPTRPAKDNRGSNCGDKLTCAHLLPRGISKWGNTPGERTSQKCQTKCIHSDPGSLQLKTSKKTSNFIILMRCLGERVSGGKMIFPQDTIKYYFSKFRRRTNSGWERFIIKSKCNQTIL